MGLLRKKTAAEKEEKKKQKDAKKKLKKEKKTIKKDARQDKKDIRKEAREDKKDIRKSGLKGKEKREAKKEVRKNKRDDIKSTNKDKRSDVKEVKEEIKKVKRWLDIELPTTAGNLALLREDLREIKYIENGVEKEVLIDDAHQILNDAYIIAKDIAAKGLWVLTNIIDEPRKDWVSLWNDKEKLVKWFGKADKPNHVKDVHDRLKSVDTRFNKQITIRLHPQRDYSTNAQNMGTFFEPKTFKVFPRLIENSIEKNTQEINYAYIASVMVHELIHIWFTDQKLDGETVYSEALALKLAEENPKKARRSAENYERYSITFA